MKAKPHPTKQGPFSTKSKLLLLIFHRHCCSPTSYYWKKPEHLPKATLPNKTKRLGFISLSKELSELVGEARRLNESVMNIDGAELQYELAWSRFDLLINNKEADSFLSREEVRVYFVSIR